MMPEERQDQLFGRSAVFAIVLAGLVLVVIVVSSAWIAVLNRERLARVDRAELALDSLAAVRTSLEDAETGQRGFLLTGRDPYLVPYTNALARLPEQMRRLRARWADAGAESSGIDQLQTAIDDKMKELAATVALARQGDVAGARTIVLSDRGQVQMDTLRRQLSELGERQRAILRLQTVANNTGNLALVVIDALGLLAVVLLAVLVLLGVRRSVALLHQARTGLAEANTSLARMNDTLEETVDKRTADLLEANAEIQRFAYIVSHDLRAPLVNIMGFTGELEVATQILRRFTESLPEGLPPDVRTAADEDLPEAIHFIKASTGKMDRLIGAILRLSREGQRELAPERLDMHAVLSGLADTVRHQAVEGEVEIVVEPLPGLTADRLAIEQIFGNIVENALKYRSPDRPGRIVVRGQTGTHFARYEVQDNGRGIAEKDRQRIFELFRRAGDQTVAGEGIGLAHVRALVRRLGGRIECESTLGVGTVFRVTLPVTTPAAREGAREGSGV